MRFEIDSKLTLRNMSPQTREAIKNRLAMRKAKFQKAVKTSRWTGGIEPEPLLCQKTNNGSVCPREAASFDFAVVRNSVFLVQYDRR